MAPEIAMEHMPWPHVAAARSFLQTLVDAEPRRLSAVSSAQLAPWLIHHELAPLVYGRLRHVWPELAAHLEADAFAAAAENSLHQKNLDDILRCFGQHGLPVVLLKGAALAQAAYGDSAFRPMSDVDLWLKPDQMGKAFGLMRELGYETAGKATRPPRLQQLAGGEIQFYRPQWRQGLVELHWAPLAGWWLQRTAAVDQAGMWRRKAVLEREQGSVISEQYSANSESFSGDRRRVEAWSAEGGVYRLAAEDMVLQVAVHLSVNHQFGMAVLRGLMDIALTAKTWPVDWQVVAARARTWRVATAVYTVLDLLRRLIGIPEMDAALAQLRPSLLRRHLLARLVSPTSVLAGRDLRGGPQRLALLLLLTDRPRDAATLVYRTLWPERAWLEARYGEQASRRRHLAHMIRARHI